MMTRTDRRRFPIIIAALAGLALAVGLFTTHAPPAHAQNATITPLLSRLDVEISVVTSYMATFVNDTAGYNSLGDFCNREPESGVVQLSGRVQPLVHG